MYSFYMVEDDTWWFTVLVNDAKTKFQYRKTVFYPLDTLNDAAFLGFINEAGLEMEAADMVDFMERGYDWSKVYIVKLIANEPNPPTPDFTSMVSVQEYLTQDVIEHLWKVR